jgi:4-hydroxy-2-oxoheptanedioate aldolase
MRRSVGYVVEGGSEAWAEALNETVIALMIEKKPAMENLDEILTVPGIDMVQFGPSDYSVSMGRPGHGGDPDIQATQREMIARALDAGVHPRVEIGNWEQAQGYLELGVRHFCIGWDIRTLFVWCKEQGSAMRKLLRGEDATESNGRSGDNGFPYQAK